MFLARAAALRTLDLSRPVGAAIFSSDGEIVCLGSNEVPKANGGTYWPEDRFDDREYKRGIDSNNERKREIISEIIQILKVDRSVESVLSEQSMRDSQFMDALEYGRIIHAEMSAICDAARLGKSVKGATLFTTTFPCHMCAKHIVAAGIDKVVFLEPYPKSLASEFHSDSLEIEGGDRGKYQHFPFVKFTHFYGVTPRRFAGFFERGRRKNEKGIFLSYVDGEAAPMMNIYAPFYHMLEQICLEETSNILSFASDEEGQAGTQGSSRKRRARKPSGSKPSSSS